MQHKIGVLFLFCFTLLYLRAQASLIPGIDSAMGVSVRHAEFKRHSQGTFTSDYSKYLDRKMAYSFIDSLMKMSSSGKKKLSPRASFGEKINLNKHNSK
uniref:Mengal gland glucagon-like peptide isoform 2 mgGLP2 n=1 Tax=Desmognathus ocoee TaxID=179530 RepID=A0A0H4ACB6_9SALA|nr:mengal gland glucagon-like peptide isoform 2 mgGLP2 [Desmognathus ocoee]